MSVALGLNAPFAQLFSVRSAVALAVFLLAALVMRYTHIGRDVIATGSDRRASRVAGLNTDQILIGVFAASGASSALAGVLLSYSLGAASPVGLSDVLAPAAAAAIVGGVSVVGGRGSPAGIAAGVLTLCILRSGLSAIGVPPYVHDLVTGGILLSSLCSMRQNSPAISPPGDSTAPSATPKRSQRTALMPQMPSSQPPSSYDFVPLPDRAPLKFPGDANVALIFTINVEYWEPFRPGQKEPLFPGGPATIPHALPGDVLDTANWTWREYGQRIGIWRLMDVFDAMARRAVLHLQRHDPAGAPAHHRRDQGTRLGTGAAQLGAKRSLTYYAHDPERNAPSSAARLTPIEEVVGKPAKAWLSSAIRGTQSYAGLSQGIRPDRLLRLSQ